ncbi:MAG TPA: TetR/AcrR family transcriptional regulator [Burkholderiales bacterium]|nr:TetR/AcrR family transcriptional regulator [Burkholderiales bacterium]
MKAVAEPRGAAGVRRRLSEVIGAAAKVFAQRGYHGASTQDIADVLGIRQASLYYYFDSKEAALEAVCRDGHEAYVERLLRIARSDASASEKVAQVLLHHAAPERLDFTLVFLRERRFLPGPARKRIRALELRYERAIQRIVEQGIRSGEFRSDLDARMTTLALLGLGNSAAVWYGREPDVTPERMLRAYIDLLVRALRLTH